MDERGEGQRNGGMFVGQLPAVVSLGAEIKSACCFNL